MIQGNFEGKLHAFRRTQDGVVVSFVIHPNDVSADLAMANLGTRMMIGYAEIGDDDRPVAQRTEHKTPTLEAAGSTPAGPAKERRPFNSLPLSQQAAIRCQDRDFQEYLSVTGAEAAAKEIRDICGIESRAELNTHHGAAATWRKMEEQYQAYLTDRMYPEEARR